MSRRAELLTSTSPQAKRYLAAGYIRLSQAKEDVIERSLKAAGIVLPPKPQLILPA